MRLITKIAIAGALTTASLTAYVTAQSAPADKLAELDIAEDGRQILYLTPEQREHVRNEMRGFLFGVQSLTLAIADQDREEIARIAGDLGPKGQMGQGMGHGKGGGGGQGMQHEPGKGKGNGMGRGMGSGQHGMMANMPDEFFSYARPLRHGFKAIAEMAAEADVTDIQRAFGENLENCVACHGTFTARDAK